VKLSSAANDNLIERTRQVWQPRLQRDLGPEDARQIVENITSFFNILAEWSQAEMPRSANDNVRPEVRGAESESALARLSAGSSRTCLRDEFADERRQAVADRSLNPDA
jgi:hypothetical protein